VEGVAVADGEVGDLARGESAGPGRLQGRGGGDGGGPDRLAGGDGLVRLKLVVLAVWRWTAERRLCSGSTAPQR
jgi:hypothetical protein